MENNPFIKTEKNSPIQIPENEIVTFYSTPEYKEINYSKYRPFPTTKLKGNMYVDNSTGELREYNKKPYRTIESFKKNYKPIVMLMKGYFRGDGSERLITLTYRRLMNDIDRLSKDVNTFIKKLRKKYPDILYLCIKEPQRNSSWHAHVLAKRSGNISFDISEDEIRKMWKKGQKVHVESIYNIDGLCRYFDISKNKEKAYRLRFYPKNKHIFSHSTGMTVTKQTLPCGEALKKISTESFERVHQSRVDIIMVDTDGSELVLNSVQYQQYKKKSDNLEDPRPLPE